MLLLLFSVLLFTGCFRHYYKTNTRNSADAALIEELKAAKKYFIIHSGDKVMGTTQVTLVGNAIETDLVALPKEHSNYTQPILDKDNAMKKKHEANTLMEVHFYTNITFSKDHTYIVIPLSSISRLDVYEFDEKATRQYRVLSILGLAAGTLLLAGAIFAIANPVPSF